MNTFILGVCACLAVSLTAAAQDRPTIAVFPPIGVDVVSKAVGADVLEMQEMSRQIEEGIRATRRFSIFERSAEVLSKAVLVEQEFSQGRQAVGDAAELGKMNNVQYVLQPQVTRMALSVRRSPMDENPGRFRYAVSGSVAVSAKVLNTTTAEIMYQMSLNAELAPGNRVSSNINGPNDAPAVFSAAWSALSKDIAKKVTNAVVNSIFPLLVVQTQGEDIFINRGEGGGIALGETYQLFSVGGALIDSATNEKLGELEGLLGEVVIVRVTPRFSVAHEKVPLSGKVKQGDIIRLPP